VNDWLLIPATRRGQRRRGARRRDMRAMKFAIRAITCGCGCGYHHECENANGRSSLTSCWQSTSCQQAAPGECRIDECEPTYPIEHRL